MFGTHPCRYDPPDVIDHSVTVVGEDVEMLNDFYAVEEYNSARLTPWLLRLILDERLTVDKHLLMDYIAQRIRDEYEVGLHIIHQVGVHEPTRDGAPLSPC